MRVPHDEGVADHIGPESCGGIGNDAAEALTGGSVGGPLSSEITAIRVPTLLLGGEGNIVHSVISELWADPAESENLACVDALCAGIERSVYPPIPVSWNGRIQPVKISWCTGWRPFPIQAENTKPGRWYRVGWRRSNSASPSQNGTWKSDNNIVPRKRANKGNMSPLRSLWREGR